MFVLFLFSVTAHAAEISVPEVLTTLIEDEHDAAELLRSKDVNRMLNGLLELFDVHSSGAVAVFGKVLAILVLAALVRAFSGENEELQITSQIDALVSVTTFFLICTPLLSLLTQLEDAIWECRNFMMAFVPAFSAVLAGAGQAAVGAVFSGFFLTGAAAAAEFVCVLLLPLLKIFMALNIVGGISTELDLSGFSILILHFTKRALSICATVFCALVGLQGLSAGAADNLAKKAGRLLIGSGVPIVGHAVSDALSSVYASLGVIKGAAGIAGICAMIGLFLPILLQCAAYYLLLYLAGATAKLTGNYRCAATFSGFCSCVELYAAIVAFFAVLIIVSTAMMIGIGG